MASKKEETNMKFPPFGIKEILAALAEGKARAMTEGEKMGYAGAGEGAIILEIGDPVEWAVVIGPDPNGTRLQFTVIDGHGNEFVMVYKGKWYAI